MGWSAKPKGAYAIDSDEALGNMQEFKTFFDKKGYGDEVIGALLGNAYGESGLNPWRYQGDIYGTSRGYGLFQWTPASGYFNGAKDNVLFAPNKSVSKITDGAEPYDGGSQLEAFYNDTPKKWASTCWRSYWDKDEYKDLYRMRANIIDMYGDGETLPLSDFGLIMNIDEAVFAFLACFEGPKVPNFDTRLDYAIQCFKLLFNRDPMISDPPEPEPTPKRKGLPIYMMLRYNL